MNVSLRGANRRAEHHSYTPTIRTLLNLCAVQGVEMSVFLNAPREASSPLLIDQWSGLHYLPIPSAAQAQRIYIAYRYLEDFTRANPRYLPPMKVLLGQLPVQKIALRDACTELYDSYEEKYLSQGTWIKKARLLRAFFCALRIMSKDREGSVKPSLKEVATLAECRIEDARLALSAVAIVQKFKIEVRLDRYRREMSPRDSFYWVMSRWADKASK